MCTRLPMKRLAARSTLFFVPVFGTLLQVLAQDEDVGVAPGEELADALPIAFYRLSCLSCGSVRKLIPGPQSLRKAWKELVEICHELHSTIRCNRADTPEGRRQRGLLMSLSSSWLPRVYVRLPQAPDDHWGQAPGRPVDLAI